MKTTAGASARQQFEHAREQAVRAGSDRDAMGIAVLALLPLSTYLLIHYGVARLQAVAITTLACLILVVRLRAAAVAEAERAGRWAAGAAGEEQTAEYLAPLERHGVTVFHDVVLPGRRENADHILVGPFGVVVVETKRWKGKVVAGRRTLRVGWRSRNQAIDQVERVAGHVERWIEAPVGRVLCIHGASVRPAWYRWRASVRGVEVTDGEGLARAARRARPERATRLSPGAVRELCGRLELELGARW